MDFTFPVAYESDVEQVKKIVVDVMTSDGRVDLDPAPFCKLKEFNTSSLDFFANCWCDASDYWDVYYYVMENVFNEFKRYGVTVPFTQVEIREHTTPPVMPFNEEPLQKRVEKKREKAREPALKRAYEEAKKSLEDKIKNKKKKEVEKSENSDENK